MPECAIVAITAFAAVFLLWIVFVALPYCLDRPIDLPESTSADATPHRECHAAPMIPFTVEQAHRVLQERIDCDIRVCPRKNAAYWTMVDTGYGTPGGGVRR